MVPVLRPVVNQHFHVIGLLPADYFVRCMSLVVALKRPSAPRPEGPLAEVLRKSGVMPDPLPAELQGYVDFAVGVLAVSKHRDAALAFVEFISSPEAAPLIRKSGMEPPPR